MSIMCAACAGVMVVAVCELALLMLQCRQKTTGISLSIPHLTVLIMLYTLPILYSYCILAFCVNASEHLLVGLSCYLALQYAAVHRVCNAWHVLFFA